MSDFQVVYSPWELPVNTAAAQAFADLHPEAVDTGLTLDDTRHAQANDAIQHHVDHMADTGIIVEDPRLENGGFTPPDGGGGDATPTVTAVSPTSGSNGTLITLTGTALTGTTDVRVDSTWSCTDVTIDSDTQVTAVTPSGPHKGSDLIIVTVNGTDITGPSFQVT